MKEVYEVYACVYIFLSEVCGAIAEFEKKEAAEKAIEYLKKTYGGKYKIYKEILFESFDEFVEYERQIEKQNGGD